MSSFSVLERTVAVYLRQFPRIKAFLKLCFQSLMYFKHKKNYKYCVYVESNKLKAISDVNETFFGYFAQPVRKGDKFLYHASKLSTNKSPKHYRGCKDVVQVVCQTDQGKEIFRASTRAFNWQQGAKLSWIDDVRFIYNDLDENGQVIAKLVCLQNGNVTSLSMPVYEVINSETYISLSYGALTRLNSDYGYYESSGINDLSYFSVLNFNGKIIFSQTINDINHQLNITGDITTHCLNHASVSPNSKDVVTIHRSYPNGVRTDRLLYIDLSLSDPTFSVIIDSGMVSHYDWLSENMLICYMRYDGEEGYYTINLGESVDVQKINIPELATLGDGHPAAVNATSFITDTYPDKSRIKKLILVDLEISTIKLLGEFYEPLKFSSEGRCDLHPRFDSKLKEVFFDSDHNGKRKLYSLDIGDVVI